VFNGLQEIKADAALVAVHDSARPLVTAADSSKCFADAYAVGAAVLGAPVKPTIKEVDGQLNVIKTLQRSKLWEVFTPQVREHGGGNEKSQQRWGGDGEKKQ
jgi:2-C-methyl-D-erythritol 4-phosphate cytidylyltransferase